MNLYFVKFTVETLQELSLTSPNLRDRFRGTMFIRAKPDTVQSAALAEIKEQHGDNVHVEFDAISNLGSVSEVING